jgi:hypothetical protein
MTKDHDKAQAIAFARGELESLDEKLAPLLAERRAVSAYLARLTGEDVLSVDEPDLPPKAGDQSGMKPVPVAGNPEIKAYHSRAFNKRTVDEAIDMIRAAGRPLSAPEINQTHSARALIPTEMLYRLMYNRVVSGVLMTINGAFWPEGEDLPAGYDIASAKRSNRITGGQ